MARSLAWLAAGLVLFGVVVVLSAPELALGDLAATGQLMILAGIAGVPGLVLLLVAVAKRRGTPAGTGPEDGHPDTQRRDDVRRDDRTEP